MNSLVGMIDDFKRDHPELMRPNVGIYLIHALVPALVGWTCVWLLLSRQTTPYASIACYAGAIIGFYHAAALTHEFSHAGRGSLFKIRCVWNAVIGSWLGIPTFLYSELHIDHHGKWFNTARDVEYLPLRGRGIAQLIGFVLLNFILPWLALIRFALLGPCCLVHAASRRWLWRNATYMGMRSRFSRRIPRDQGIRRQWLVEEAITTVVIWSFLALLISGTISIQALVVWYVIIVGVGLMNAIRAIAVTHRYRCPGDRPVSFEEHLRDTLDIESTTIGTCLFCPMAFQYHLTHHLFPSMPFHHLGSARKLFREQFPQESFYRQNVRRGIVDGVVSMIRGT